MYYPIGMIPYSNMEPFRQLGEPEYCRFVPLVPKESVKAIKLGNIVAAAIPVGGLPYISNLVETVGHFGIATKKNSMSVLFFSKVPFNSLSKKHKIQLTSESESSIRLLYLLLGYLNGFDNIPRISYHNNKTIDGRLIIGDKALIRSKVRVNFEDTIFLDGEKNWPYVTDLAQLWYEVKGIPFVFARWVIRKDVPIVVKRSIEKWLHIFEKQEKELVNKAVKVSSKILGISNYKMILYFKVIRRILNYDDILGQKLFMNSFKKNINKMPTFQ